MPAAASQHCGVTSCTKPACTGISADLAPSECTAWQNSFDDLNGTSWPQCNTNRNDPCACSSISCTVQKQKQVSITSILMQFALLGVLPPQWSEFTNIEAISIMSDDLTGNLPPQWGTLTKLQLLQLHSSIQGSLPPSWSGMTSLKVFDMEPLGTGAGISGTLSTAVAKLRSIARVCYAVQQVVRIAPCTMGKYAAYEIF